MRKKYSQWLSQETLFHVICHFLNICVVLLTNSQYKKTSLLIYNLIVFDSKNFSVTVDDDVIDIKARASLKMLYDSFRTFSNKYHILKQYKWDYSVARLLLKYLSLFLSLKIFYEKWDDVRSLLSCKNWKCFRSNHPSENRETLEKMRNDIRKQQNLLRGLSG